MKEDEKQIVKVGGQSVEITNPDKILYPDDTICKKDIVDYYQKIAKTILPHVEGRVLSMEHYPDGIKKEGFFQKRVPDYFPNWIKTVKVKLHEGDSEEVVVIEKEADLVYLANQAVLPLHVWLSRVNNINKPDKIIFDLDPPGSNDYDDLRFVAQKIKEKFEKLGFSVYIMTTGANGFHVCIPIKPTKDFDYVRDIAHAYALELVKEYPEKLTLEVHKNSRRGKIFLDYLRNSYGQTSISPYALRAEPGAPVAAPFRWNELSRIKPRSYNIKSIFQHIQNGDPWKDFYKKQKNFEI